MSIIKLKNVSKYYYNKGVIASGFTKINLEFSMGEFVAITGESGSGKSTLLNVISGLDTYEEGEMYINGKETSHYGETDFENYRRRYIGNIFQNFNLINSYTVYQNIELVLLLNGAKKSEIKDKVIELIKTVNLYKFRNTKVSKLSGGQKQRVAIARALAKDTPIIIADEPTGNLDSRSAKSIIKLLSEISKEKLVIIVTHNYEQVEDYVTRKIKMHDGKILEDKKIKDIDKNIKYNTNNYKNITKFEKLRLGIRNTFNIMPKFLLLLAVYLFIVVALMAEYSGFKEQEYIAENSGYNDYFQDTSDRRIVIKKEDKTSITEEDYQKLSNLDNVSYIVKNDILLDTSINMTDNNNFWIYGNAHNISNYNKGVDVGRLPKESNEVLVVGSKNDYYLNNMANELMKTDLYLQSIDTGEINKDLKLRIVGIKYTTSNNLYANSKIYLSDEAINTLKFEIYRKYSNIQVKFLDNYYTSDNSNNNFKVVPNNNVKSGSVYISGDLNNECKNNNCLGEKIQIEVTNLYYQDILNLTIEKTYDKKNIKNILNIDNYEDNNGCIYINPNDYNNLFNKDNYQSSIYIKDVDSVDTTISNLKDMGYNTLKVKDTLVKDNTSQMVKIFKTVVTICLVLTLFFISYFVIRIILKSRTVYFSTIRMLGATRKICKDLLIIELLNVANIAYFTFLIIIYMNYSNIINVGFIDTIIDYLKLSDYLLLYLILLGMSLLISMKFSKKLFKRSAITTIGEGV